MDVSSRLITAREGIEDEMPSHEYQAASQAMSDAVAQFRIAQQDYRDQRIGDREFLAAKKIYDRYVAEFDAAFEKEQI